MSWKFYNQTTPTARKQYSCDAAEWIVNHGIEDVLYNCTDYEKADIEKAQNQSWKIQPGEKYVKVVGVWEGEFSTFRAKPELDAICHRLNIYDDL